MLNRQSLKVVEWDRFCPQDPAVVQGGHQLAWSVPCDPLMLQSSGAVLHICCVLLPLRFALSWNGCAAGSGREELSGLLSLAPWVMSAEVTCFMHVVWALQGADKSQGAQGITESHEEMTMSVQSQSPSQLSFCIGSCCCSPIKMGGI